MTALDLDAIRAKYSAAHHGQADVVGLSDEQLADAVDGARRTRMLACDVRTILALASEVRERRKLHDAMLGDLDALVREVERLRPIEQLAKLIREQHELWESLATIEPKHGLDCVSRHSGEDDAWDCGADCGWSTVASMSARLGEVEDAIEQIIADPRRVPTEPAPADPSRTGTHCHGQRCYFDGCSCDCTGCVDERAAEDETAQGDEVHRG